MGYGIEVIDPSPHFKNPNKEIYTHRGVQQGLGKSITRILIK